MNTMDEIQSGSDNLSVASSNYKYQYKEDYGVASSDASPQLEISSNSTSSSHASNPSDKIALNNEEILGNKNQNTESSESQNNLKAAIKMEEEFLKFMFTLPKAPNFEIEEPIKHINEAVSEPSPQSSKKLSTTKRVGQNPPNETGLEHLDKLCRVVDHLSDLKEKNKKLQYRVNYLEQMKVYYDFELAMKQRSGAPKISLSLESLSISDSNELEDFQFSSSYMQNSQDSLDILDSKSNDKKQPESQNEKEESSTSLEKSGPKTTWGKVKHMISHTGRRESGIKKSSANLDSPRKNKSFVIPKTTTSTETEKIGANSSFNELILSDLEIYDVDADISDDDSKGGIWMGPKYSPECPQTRRLDAGFNEATRNSMKQNRSTTREEKKKSCDTQANSSQNSNWAKVKQTFLTVPGSPGGIDLSKDEANSFPHFPKFFNNKEDVGTLLSQSFSFHFPTSTRKQMTVSHNEASHSGPRTASFQNAESFKEATSLVETESHEHPRKQNEGIISFEAQKNLTDIQRSMTEEFSKKLLDWDRYKQQHRGVYHARVENPRIGEKDSHIPPAEDSLPLDFKKKLNEWEKMKTKYTEKYVTQNRVNETSTRIPNTRSGHPHLLHIPLHYHHMFRHQDYKTKKLEERNLPSEFKKKLTEWEIRKALVGKGEQSVEQLQKKLGNDFNKKMAEWQRIKAVDQDKIVPQEFIDSDNKKIVFGHYELPFGLNFDSTNKFKSTNPTPKIAEHHKSVSHEDGGQQCPDSADMCDMRFHFTRKDSGKVKKAKGGKLIQSKNESPKQRNKEIIWLKKELAKIEKEKQKLERDTEKFNEREARLEKIRHAMDQELPDNKELYIKTPTGEFRFEGINQTFTKKLYEWEKSRGIRPESSTFVFLDPKYTIRRETYQRENSMMSTETRKIARSLSEPSLLRSLHKNRPKSSNQRSNSVVGYTREKHTKGSETFQRKLSIEAESQTSPKPLKMGTLDSRGTDSEDGLPLIPKVEPPYAPVEVTKLIDSSESDEMLNRGMDEEFGISVPKDIEEEIVTTAVEFDPTEQQRSEDDYELLLKENMTLFGQLKEQEDFCRALESEMGNIDSRMNNVADQHLKTLEKLHKQVTIMHNSENDSSVDSSKEERGNEERSRRSHTPENSQLIKQLKDRIEELELKGDKLMAEKEELEHVFMMHKNHESQIAESLLFGMRELQDKGAEVSLPPPFSEDEAGETRRGVKENGEIRVLVKSATAPSTPLAKRKRRKKRNFSTVTNEAESNEENESEDAIYNRKKSIDSKEKHKRKQRLSNRKVRKLDNLTADILIQAKRLEGALSNRQSIYQKQMGKPNDLLEEFQRKTNLRGQSSLRLSREENQRRTKHRTPKQSFNSRTWSSIEAIASTDSDSMHTATGANQREAADSESESHELMQMNAEISRMAKELRKEMVNVCYYKDSTSTESISSDNREEVIKAKLSSQDVQREANQGQARDPEKEWIAEEARDVLNGIASLRMTRSTSEDEFEGQRVTRELPVGSGQRTVQDSFNGFCDSNHEQTETDYEAEDQSAKGPRYCLENWNTHGTKSFDKTSSITSTSSQATLSGLDHLNLENQEPSWYDVTSCRFERRRSETDEEDERENKFLESLRLSPYYNVIGSRPSLPSSESEDEPQTSPPSTTRSSLSVSTSSKRLSVHKASTDSMSGPSPTYDVDRRHLMLPRCSKSYTRMRTLENNEEEFNDMSRRTNVSSSDERNLVNEGVNLDTTGLKTRRISDSQIEYDENFDFENSLSNNVPLCSKYVSNAYGSSQIAKNNNDSGTNKDSSTNSASSLDGIFVSTQRTLFQVNLDDQIHQNTKSSFIYIDDHCSSPSDAKSEDSISNNKTFHSNSGKTNKLEVDQSFDHMEGVEIRNVYGEAEDTHCEGNKDKISMNTSSYANIRKNQQNLCYLTSKNMVLEGANKSSPMVKNMIDFYNKRISEKQELLLNPFSLNLNGSGKDGCKSEESLDSLDDLDQRFIKKQSAYPSDKIFKSNSEVFFTKPHENISHSIQKSFSGTTNNEIQRNFDKSQKQYNLNHSKFSPILIRNKYSNRNDSLSEIAEYESSEDFESTSSTKLRADKIRRAKEEFLARGTVNGSLFSLQDLEEKNSTKTKSCNSSEEFDANKNCNGNNLTDIKKQSSSHTPKDKQQKLEEFQKRSSPAKTRPKNVLSEQNKITETSRPKKIKEAPMTSNSLFKFFKIGKTKEKKDSIYAEPVAGPSNVNEGSLNENRRSRPSSELSESEDFASPRTLPRGNSCKSRVSFTSSCPSSPMQPRKSKASQILALSKNLFKSRSPSPNKQPK